MSEAALKRSVVRALTLALRGNGKVLRLNSGKLLVGTAESRRLICGTEAGTPDLLVMLPGRVVWIELKSPTGRLTATQRRWHEQARRLGHTVYVCRSIGEALAAVGWRAAAGEGGSVTATIHKLPKAATRHECCPNAGSYLRPYGERENRYWRLVIALGEVRTSVGVTHCPWCGEELPR